MQFMDGVSQLIFAATNQLVNYPPFLGGYLLSNFIHPVYRLSRTPASDETPFAGLSPAISASQAYRQLSQPYRLFPNDLRLRLLGRNLSLVATNDLLMRLLGQNLSLVATNDLLMRLLGRNLSLVAGDLHLATSISRDLEVAKQSSCVLQGESSPPPPPFFTAWGFVTFEACCCCSRRCSCLGDGSADDVPAYAGPYRRQSRT